MNLLTIAKNQNEVEADGVITLFSYRTPVARIKDGRGYRSTHFWSVTTSKHVAAFFKRHGVTDIIKDDGLGL